MNTTIQQRETIQRKSKSLFTDRTVDASKSDDGQPIDMVIASLVDQLKRENENIAKLMERQRELRLELLKAQEQSLAALRRPNREVCK